MQTSRAKTNLARAGKVFAFLCVAIALDMAFIFAFQSYGMTHDAIWYNYRKTPANTLDTLVIGSSYSSFGIDPTTLDEAIDSSSYNLSTMAQTFHNSMDVIDTVQKSHDIKRIVLCIGQTSLQSASEYDREVLFFQSKSVGEPLPDILHNLATLALNETNFPTSKSLMWMFPWLCDPVDPTPQAVATNIRNRLEHSDPTEVLSYCDDRWCYMGRGHCGYNQTLNFENMSESTRPNPSATPFIDTNVREYCELLDKCAQSGYETYVIIGPHPDCENLLYQDDTYPQLMTSLQKMTEDHGATYLDFNMTKPDVYRPKKSDFLDLLHLNVEGSKRFSKAIGTIISKIEAGQEVDGLFYTYDNWDEYLNSYSKVALCYYSHVDGKDSTEITAHAIARPNTEIEYKFEIAPKDTDEYRLLRDYSSDDHYTISNAEHSKYRLRITARAVGSNDPKDSCPCYI